jgi:hypothetical protein
VGEMVKTVVIGKAAKSSFKKLKINNLDDCSYNGRVVKHVYCKNSYT